MRSIYRHQQLQAKSIVRFAKYYFLVTRRTPGPSSGEPKNSTPLSSKVRLTKSKFCALLDGTDTASSILLIVATPTFEYSANSLARLTLGCRERRLR